MIYPYYRLHLSVAIAALLLPAAVPAADVIGILPDSQPVQPGTPVRPEPTRPTPVRPGDPDPALFDGSKLEPEKRPDDAMLAEFEVPGQENPEQQRIAQSESGESGGGGSPQQQAEAGGAPPEGQQESGGGNPPPQNDPAARPEGIQVANLQIPEGVDPASQDSAPASSKPPEVSLGDATMQIQTVSAPPASASQQQATNTQQYEKGAAQGNQTGDNRNRGAERGQSVPSGL